MPCRYLVRQRLNHDGGPDVIFTVALVGDEGK